MLNEATHIVQYEHFKVHVCHRLGDPPPLSVYNTTKRAYKYNLGFLPMAASQVFFIIQLL